MANAERGEVPFGDTGFNLHFGINAICELEAAVKQPFVAVIKALDGGEASFDLMRALVWAGLLKSKPGIKPAQVGDLMDQVGLAESIAAVGAAVKAAYPAAEAGDAEKN